MKKLLTAMMLVAFVATAKAQFGFGAAQQQNGEPKAPELEYVVRLNVTIGQAYSSGNNGKGTRTIIPITGGTFEGPNIKGEGLPGGADYQLAVDGRKSAYWGMSVSMVNETIRWSLL